MKNMLKLYPNATRLMREDDGNYEVLCGLEHIAQLLEELTARVGQLETRMQHLEGHPAGRDCTE